jgi:hypothetical protein
MVLRIIIEIVGILIVLYGLLQVFRDIFHPTASGSLSDGVGRIVSATMKHTRFRPAVGAVSLVLTILCWVAILVAGFGLIYSGLLGAEVTVSQGPIPSGWPHTFLRSLYLSLGSFDTFQTFNLSAQTEWLRLVIAIEGLIGISMITASISWLVLLYPALERTRQFARLASSWLEAEQRTGIGLLEQQGTPAMRDITRGVLQFRLDIILFPILLNFYSTNDRATVGFVLPAVLKLAVDGSEAARDPSIRLASTQLHIALEDLCKILAERVLHRERLDMQAVLESFREREQ